MMPDIDGFEFAASVCAIDQNISILFMTARDDFSSKAKGYRLGIDDYVVKPVDLEELVLRLESLLRRAKIAASKQLTVGNLMLDEDAVSAAVNGAPVPLTLREFQIIYKLLAYPNISTLIPFLSQARKPPEHRVEQSHRQCAQIHARRRKAYDLFRRNRRGRICQHQGQRHRHDGGTNAAHLQ